MIDSLLRFLVSTKDNVYESYYQRVLSQAGVEVAPTFDDARRDYDRYLRTRREL